MGCEKDKKVRIEGKYEYYLDKNNINQYTHEKKKRKHKTQNTNKKTQKTYNLAVGSKLF